MQKLLAYSHPSISKELFVAEIEAHTAADRFVQGSYGNDSDETFRGCAVGCSLETVNRKLKNTHVSTSDHGAYETYLGIPRVLAKLEDRIFEGLPIAEAKAWPLRFSSAIPQGADLSSVWNEFCPWMLREIVLPTVSDQFPDVRTALERVIKGYETNWQNDAARAAAYAATDAAAAAARAAADAAYAARAAAYRKMADKLCELLAAAPIPVNI
jgi:hypothetical protein